MAKTRKPRGPKLTVQITRELIDAAMPKDSSHCMIAEAIKSAVPDARYVSVDLHTIRYTDPIKPLRYTFLTPRKAAVALVEFDSGQKPEPFSVVLRGAHVTKSGAKPKRDLTSLTADQTERLEKRRAMAKANLTQQTIRTEENGSPRRVGGRAVPQMRLTNAGGKPIPFPRRREFGMRALVR